MDYKGYAGYHGWKKIVLGVLLLLNAFVWPQWTSLTGWISFIAILFVLGGIVALIWPCKHSDAPAQKPRRR